MDKPTFDECHLKKYRQTFEERWYVPGIYYDDVFKGLCEDIRSYTTEMAKT
jgi:hypothetical protein